MKKVIDVLVHVYKFGACRSEAETGKIDVAKLNPILYDPIRHDYRAMGEKVGKAFSDGRALK